MMMVVLFCHPSGIDVDRELHDRVSVIVFSLFYDLDGYCRDPEGILACCTHIPPLVQQNLSELHSIIRNARERPIEKVSIDVYNQRRLSLNTGVVGDMSP